MSFSKSQRKKLLRHSLGDPKRVIYVSTQTDDDFSYVISYAGEENLVIGTDYGHGDTSSELNAISRFKVIESLNPQVKPGKFFPAIQTILRDLKHDSPNRHSERRLLLIPLPRALIFAARIPPLT